jgi:hypothetical protein
VDVPDPPRRPLTINRTEYRPTLDDVLKAMAGVPTTPIPPGGWFAKVGRRRYPLKQVVARTLGLRGQDFSLPHAQAFARYVGLIAEKAPGTYERRTAGGT